VTIPHLGYQPKDDAELEDILSTSEPRAKREESDVPNTTDLGNAKRLVRRYGDRIRFVPQSKTWLCYTGGRWMQDDSGEIVRLAKQTALAIYDEAQAAPVSEQKRLADHARHSQSKAKLDAMIALAWSEEGIPVSPEDLDLDPLLLNVENGTIDLESSELLDHDPDDLITKQAPVIYDATATCPRWDAFLSRVLQGDRDLISFIQRAVGYSLTGQSIEQIFFMLYGLGANGKSTFIDTLKQILGGYATHADYGTFLSSRNEKSGSDLARLRGARFVAAAEPDDAKRLDEAAIKKITGGEPVMARFLYGEPFEYTPQFKLWLSGNHKPTIKGDDHAMWRRIYLIPFLVTIPREEWDVELKAKLLDEAPGILRWAVEGCLEWRQYGLKPPSAVTNATAEYREESDTLGQFLAECCELGEDYSEEANRLFDTYRSWALARNYHPLTSSGFGRRLTERGIPSDKHTRTGSRKGKVRRLGVRLLDDSDFFRRGDSGGQLRPYSVNSPTRDSNKNSSQNPLPTVPNRAPGQQLSVEDAA
jgi:putative DNA primase/helicase